jgi:hypothetical protein
MNPEVKKELSIILHRQDVYDFEDIDWKWISGNLTGFTPYGTSSHWRVENEETAPKLSEEFILEFHDKLDWIMMSSTQILSESIIRQFQDKVDWSDISVDQKLSDEFLHELSDKVDWRYMSKFKKLSEDFMRKFHDKLDWMWLSANQHMTDAFIIEFKDSIDWAELCRSNSLSTYICTQCESYITLHVK